MPRFYFHVRDDEIDAVISDPSGIDLPDLQSVRSEALEAARELIIDAIRTDKSIDGRHFIVMDGAGNEVLTFSFEDVVRYARKQNGSPTER